MARKSKVVKGTLTDPPKEELVDKPLTEKDLDAEERGERKPRGFHEDPMGLNQLVGVTFCHTNYCENWILNGQYLRVARWYIHSRLAIDFGQIREVLEARAKYFATTDIAYCFIAPGERLSEEQMRARIKEAIDGRSKRG